MGSSHSNVRARNISGGTVLGKGSFGCVITPVPPCSGYTSGPGTVGKIMLPRSSPAFFDFFLKSETLGLMLMTKIDPYHNFTIHAIREQTGPESFEPRIPCKIPDASLDADDARDCGITPSGADVDAILINKLEGKTLTNLFMDLRYSDVDVYIEDLCRIIIQVLFGLVIMEGRVCHFDLHSSNIFVTDRLPGLRSAAGPGGAAGPGPGAAGPGPGAAGPDAAGPGGAGAASPGVPFGRDNYGEVKMILKPFPIDFTTTMYEINEFIRNEGYDVDNPDVRRAAVEFFRSFQDKLFRKPSDLRDRPYIIDYGKVMTIRSYVRFFAEDPRRLIPLFWQHPAEFLIVKNLLRSNWDSADFASTLASSVDRSGFKYLSPNKSKPFNWHVRSRMQDTTDAYHRKLLASSLDERFLRRLFNEYESIIFEDLKYDRTDQTLAMRDFFYMLLSKQDSTLFMSYFVGWHPNVSAARPELRSLCDAIRFAAKCATYFNCFQRPFPFQIYDYLLPFCKRLGWKFETTKIQSAPFEEVEYLEGSINPSEAFFADDIKKVDSNKTIVYSINQAQIMLRDGASCFSETSKKKDLLQLYVSDKEETLRTTRGPTWIPKAAIRTGFPTAAIPAPVPVPVPGPVPLVPAVGIVPVESSSTSSTFVLPLPTGAATGAAGGP